MVRLCVDVMSGGVVLILCVDVMCCCYVLISCTDALFFRSVSASGTALLFCYFATFFFSTVNLCSFVVTGSCSSMLLYLCIRSCIIS